jgi:hypothetical protein
LKKLMSSTILVVSLVMLSFMFFTPAAHAARTAQLLPADAPDVQCLDVSASNVSGQETVAVKTPPGGGVHYTLSLYVINDCPQNHRVSNITIVGTASGKCPRGNLGSADVKYNGSYPIYPNAGFGDSYGITDFCAVTENGKIVASVVPTTITVTVNASGSYIDGQAGQIATSNTKVIQVWPA